ncbi:hypothetical protein MUK42_28865 [Musa troglodytarum]|uniref:Uncharacterized protein n=1 Tax=Musa troglodytarum TaxID=320322 RepID=A0A9E7FGS9_9LILI|nr:hypothetical protein MUK42_28865 [Musa troglodytarum]
MASLIFARTLAGPSLPTAARLFSFRRLSGRPEKVELFEQEIQAEDPYSEIEVLGMRRLEEAIHAIIVRRSAPDWLPFIPGSSYWVPPRRRPHGVIDLVRRLTYPMTEDEVMSFTTDRGWPSSAYFVEGTSLQPVKKSKGRTKVHSDDEER